VKQERSGFLHPTSLSDHLKLSDPCTGVFPFFAFAFSNVATMSMPFRTGPADAAPQDVRSPFARASRATMRMRERIVFPKFVGAVGITDMLV
jgi:hypothetical protein